MRATIKSIASDLGISHMTVSRALSGSENVNPKTRQNIIEYAVKIGYVKNSAAIMMRGEASAIIGLLLPNITNEFYAYFANSLGVICSEAGFDLVIHLTNDDYKLENKSLTRMQALQARSVIRVPSPRPQDFEPNTLVDLQIFDLIRASGEDNCNGSLIVDDGQSIQKAVDLQLAKGSENIAYIGANENLSSGRERLVAFKKAIKNQNVELVENSIKLTASPSYEMGYSSMEELLLGTNVPDAVICGGFELSNGALDACLKNSVSIPGDIAFVGYGDPSFYQWVAGGITTISLPIEEIALSALQLVQTEIITVENKQIMLPTKLTIRNSV